MSHIVINMHVLSGLALRTSSADVVVEGVNTKGGQIILYD